jgi:hypothetical protein
MKSETWKELDNKYRQALASIPPVPTTPPPTKQATTGSITTPTGTGTGTGTRSQKTPGSKPSKQQQSRIDYEQEVTKKHTLINLEKIAKNKQGVISRVEKMVDHLNTLSPGEQPDRPYLSKLDSEVDSLIEKIEGLEEIYPTTRKHIASIANETGTNFTELDSHYKDALSKIREVIHKRYHIEQQEKRKKTSDSPLSNPGFATELQEAKKRLKKAPTTK